MNELLELAQETLSILESRIDSMIRDLENLFVSVGENKNEINQDFQKINVKIFDLNSQILNLQSEFALFKSESEFSDINLDKEIKNLNDIKNDLINWKYDYSEKLNKMNFDLNDIKNDLDGDRIINLENKIGNVIEKNEKRMKRNIRITQFALGIISSLIIFLTSFGIKECSRVNDLKQDYKEKIEKAEKIVEEIKKEENK